VRPSQQVLKVKIDGPPRKREATVESAVWHPALRFAVKVAHPRVAGHFSEKSEKERTPELFRSMLRNKPALYFVVKVAHPHNHTTHLLP